MSLFSPEWCREAPEDHAHRILLIEDEEGIRSVLAEALAEEGYEVGTAAHGEDGLRQTLESRPCGVLVDLMLPVMDGVQYIEACRGRPDLKGLPIVAMSAKHRGDPVVRLGVQGFLAKPFDLHEVLAIVSTVVGRGDTTPSVEPNMPETSEAEVAGN